MSFPGDNWVVPSANPNNNSQGGVQTLEGLVGNVNLTGDGITITGASPTPQDIRLAAAVQTLVAGTNCTITQSPTGTFTISSTGGGGGGAGMTVVTTTEVVALGSVPLLGGGSPVFIATPSPPPVINAALNPDVFVIIQMSMTGFLFATPPSTNEFRIGLENASGSVLSFNSGLVPQPNYNWEVIIPDPNNYIIGGFIPIATLSDPTLAYKAFMAFPYAGTPPYYVVSNMRFRASYLFAV
jgi:hypothetical protein